MVRVIQQDNFLNDAYILLYTMANTKEKETLESMAEKHRATYGLLSPNYDEKFQSIIRIYHYVTKNIRTDHDRIQFLFHELNSELTTLAELIMTWDYKKYNYSLEDYRTYIRNLSDEERLGEFMKFIDSQEYSSVEKNKLKSLEDFIYALDKTSLDTTMKWEVMKIYQNPLEYFEEVASIMEEVIELIKHCQEDITFLQQEFIRYWTQEHNVLDIPNLIKNQLNIKWNYSEKGIVIILSLFNPISISISMDEVEGRSEDVIYLGAIIDERLVYKPAAPTKEDVISIGKLISDNSKLDILKFVCNKPAYGKELATALGLTSATISYHVNALLEAGFIKADIDSGKVYYRTNIPEIERNLEVLKEYFRISS